MSTKVERLVAWCRTQNVIPASGTQARNDLADLVMGQPIEDIKKAFSTFKDEPDSVKRWKWLVANVCDIDSGTDLLDRTVLSYRWYLVQKEHEEDITKGWGELHTAKLKFASDLRDLDARELRMTATVNDLKVTQQKLDDAYRELRSLRSDIEGWKEREAENEVFRQALRHGMWLRKPLTEQRVLDQYAEAVRCARDLDCGYPDDDLVKPARVVIDDALALFTEIGTPPEVLAEWAAGWSVDRPTENEGESL